MGAPSETARVRTTPDELAVAALQSLPTAVALVFDSELTVLHATGDALARWGGPAVEGLRVHEVLGGEGAGRVAEHARRALAGQRSSLVHRSADGARVNRSHFGPATARDGTVLGGVVLSRDITEELEERERIAARERQFRALAEEATDFVSRHALDGTYLYASPACRRLFGYEPEELLGTSCYDLYHPDEVDDMRRLHAEELTRAQAPLTATYRILRKDGEYAWVESTIRTTLDPDTGLLADVVAITRDVTEKRRAQEAERRAQRRFEAAFEDAPIGMALVGLDGGFLRVNRALCEIVGHGEEELCARTFQDITHPDDLEADLAHVRRLLEGESGRYQMEKRYRTSRGDEIWALLSVSLVRDDDGAPLYFVSQIQDISERKRMEAHLHRLADQDPLTGLMNRRRFEEELLRQVGRCRRYGEVAALLLLDLDNFKVVNDTLGHKVGDNLLCAVADAVSSRLRESDVCARLGGDELAVLLPGTGLTAARPVADELCERIRSTALEVDGESVRATASVGVVPLDASVEDAEAVLAAADVAMYDAKARGRDRTNVQRAGQRATSGLLWQQRLRRALVDRSFAIDAQPIVDLSTGAVVQRELLVRLLLDDGTRVAPGEFLTMAERLGHVRALDRWMIGSAVRLLGEVDAALAVNVSGYSLSDPELGDFVASALRDAGADGARLVFEVTETSAIGDMEQAVSFARDVQALGCRIAIDDFGSGFASISYLRRLPFDFLKLDGDYVRGIVAGERDRALVGALVHLGEAMGCATIAERVEDEETARVLAELGVPYAQGFHLGRPAPLSPGPSSSGPAPPA